MSSKEEGQRSKEAELVEFNWVITIGGYPTHRRYGEMGQEAACPRNAFNKCAFHAMMSRAHL